MIDLTYFTKLMSVHIVEAPTQKNGSCKGLCCLHDTLKQYLPELKIMKYKPTGPFNTSLIDMKLDQSRMFDWQQHSQDQPNMPHYSQLLDFIDLWTKASEASTHESLMLSDKHSHESLKCPSTTWPAYIANIRGSSSTCKSLTCSTQTLPSEVSAQAGPAYVTIVSDFCIACGVGKHPLYTSYTCKQFRSLSCEQCIAIVKERFSGCCAHPFKGSWNAKNCTTPWYISIK